MRKRIFVIGFVFTAMICKAQVTVSVQLPAGGMIQKDQLWNLVMVNNNSPVAEASLSLDIQDGVTGQTVLSASSRNFLLGKGVKLISIKDVQPLQYNYIAAELSGNYIPLGNYVACYRVVKNDLVKGPLALGDECVRINITPLSPPLLNLPADRAIVETPYPQFSWIPPAPLDMFNGLTYDILVAEVLPGQSAAEAVLYNPPVYANNRLRMTFENFPASFSRLKAGQQYAWQVVARNGLNYAAQTETWSFTMKPPDTASLTVNSSAYITLKSATESAGIAYVNEDELLVKYYSFDKDHETVIRFLSADGKQVKEVKQKIKYGDNFMRFRLNNEFKKETVYVINLSDEQKNSYSAKFTIQ